MNKKNRGDESPLFKQSVLAEFPSESKNRDYLKNTFPEIEAIAVKVTHQGKGFRPNEDRTVTYVEKNFPGEFIKCRNPSCNSPDAGFHLGSLIKRAVKERKTEIEDHGSCLGYEMSPKGGKVYDKCFNFFQVRLTIKYKPN
ncbi:MAG TPA: hypothetical protein VGL70_21665 [Candidatus Binatia bacterium]|jgi:hypothetical protein